MAEFSIPLTFPGHSGEGSISVNAGLRYDQDIHGTIAQNIYAIIRMGSVPGNITRATVSVTFWPTDNPPVSASASMRVSGASQTSVSGALRPVPLRLPHQLDDPVKRVRMRVSFSVDAVDSAGAFYTSGSDERVFMVDLASIIHVGDLIGSLYVAIDGKWHIGVIHAADGGDWHVGVGHVLFSVSGDEEEDQPGTITVTHDEAGNVFISGMRVTHDGDGNVFLVGATVVDDGDGHITIK